MDRNEKLIILFAIILLIIMFICSCSGLGQKVATALKTSQENKAAIKGNENKINTITNNQTKIVNDQKAFQKSQAAEFKEFKGEYYSSQKITTNNPWPYVIIIAVIMVWMYFDKSFPWFGRR